MHRSGPATADFAAAARERTAYVLQRGRRVGNVMTPSVQRALQRIVDREGSPEAVGSPRVGGIGEALYVRTRSGARLFDVSSGDEPREMQTFDGQGWLEGIAMGGRILARYDETLEIIELYTAALRRDCE